ncbi:DUF7059 domain-containing protein [Leucobacter coleopterorum]|uniref:DUF7059 domain-containing protein n=1 Tax=Leucobacter coleopterorum TaxID=2714933 RepID=UPI001FCC496B|nr:methyltransferase [Leucobacter coleopterorum]
MDPELIDLLRADLTSAEYNTAAVTSLLGVTADGARQRGVFTPALRVLKGRETSALATLTRVFLLGETGTAAELDAALPKLGHAGAEQLGLLTGDPDSHHFRAVLSLNPVALEAASGASEWWIISDLDDQLRRGPARPDHVMGVGGATRSLITQAPSGKVGSALDLGTGCGIVALHLACELVDVADAKIVATDISERALMLACANARLNGQQDRIEFRQGSLFEPVDGERFDLILSNPPFVITPQNQPADTERYEYRDGGMRGDDLVAGVVSDAPKHLTVGGTLLCLANWECPWGVDGLERAQEWIAGPQDRAEHVAAWVIERDRIEPAQYAETWARDGGARPGSEAFDTLMTGWLDDFAERNVVAIGLGSIRLQRLDMNNSCSASIHVERAGGPFSPDAGEVLQSAFKAATRVAQMSDAQLLETRWLLDSGVTEEREHQPGRNPRERSHSLPNAESPVA